MNTPQKPENLPRSLFHSFSNDYTKGSLIDMSESLLDLATESILNSEVLVKLPIVGGLVAVSKGVIDFRDRQFVSKVLRVIAETSDVDPKESAKFREEIDADLVMARRVGAVLLDLIDKATGTEKAAMIGKVVRAKMHEPFTYDEMIGLCEMIEKAYLSDLKALARRDDELGPPWNDVNLEGVGIKKPMRSEEVNDAIAASMQKVQREMPIVRDKPVPITLKKPRVYESGLTDAGAMLRRILRDY